MKVGDLVELTQVGAWNVDDCDLPEGSKGIIVQITDDEEDMGMLYTVIINNIRVPFLFDHEIRKIY